MDQATNARRLGWACQGCGQSCEGHRVGPLKDALADQIQAHWRQLAPSYPRVAQHEPLITAWTPDGDTLHFLNFPDERCVFLHEDRRCLLHQHFGPDAKPDACQRFPLLLVDADGELRAGIRPVCYRWHDTFDSAPPPPPSALALRRSHPASAHPSAIFALDYEQKALAALNPAARSPLNLPALLHVLALRFPASPPAHLPAAAWSVLTETLSTAALRLPPMSLQLAATSHGTHQHHLLQALLSAPTTSSPQTALHLAASRPLPDRLHRYLLAGLHQATALREFGPLDSLPQALSFAVMGLTFLWAITPDIPQSATTIPASIPDDFAASVVAWHRLLSQSSLHTRALPDPQWSRWCDALTG